MNRFAFLVFLAISLGLGAWAQQPAAGNDSLGNAARQNRDQKQTSSRKVWTNDDFSSGKTESAAPAADAGTTDTPSANGAAETKTQAQSAETPAPSEEEWTAKISAAKAHLADLEREMNLLEREYRLKAATYYADAGNRLRDSKGWADTEQGFQDRNNELKQQIEDAKTKLEDLQEEARKAGVSSKARE